MKIFSLQESDVTKYVNTPDIWLYEMLAKTINNTKYI